MTNNVPEKKLSDEQIGEVAGGILTEEVKDLHFVAEREKAGLVMAEREKAGLIKAEQETTGHFIADEEKAGLVPPGPFAEKAGVFFKADEGKTGILA